jgi:serine phosphatase RsbU (regulator of sigma subunit)
MNKDQSVYEILHEILTEQQNLLRKVSAKMYTQSIPSLDGSTIGGHTRHIIEFLEILRNSYHTNQINYDERQRNPELEQNPEKAMEIISEILSALICPTKI